MRRWRWYGWGIVLTLISLSCLGVLLIRSSTSARLVPPEAVRIQKHSVCGSEFCTDYTTYEIETTRTTLVQFYTAQHYHCAEHTNRLYRSPVHELTLPMWTCDRPREVDYLVTVAFKAEAPDVRMRIRLYTQVFYKPGL